MSLQVTTSRVLQRQARSLLVSQSASATCCRCTCAAIPATRSRRSSRRQARWMTSTAVRAASQTEAQQSVPQKPEDHDIVIVGGGLVGLALANALSTSSVVQNAKLKVSLLEASDLDKVAHWAMPPGKWSNRISSITSESQRFLRETGGWQNVDMSRTRPCEEMRVWDGLSGARIEFSAYDLPTKPADGIIEMAKFVENLNLQKSLLINVRNQGNVECIDKTRVADIVQGDAKEQGGWPIVKLENGRTIRARLLVGADGFNSPVKSYSEIKTDGWAYDAHCLVGTLELESTPLDTNFIAWQRFLPVGPVGFLPIADNYASLAWSTKPEIAAALKKLDAPTLTALINASFRLPWPSLAFLYDRLHTSPSTLRQDMEWRYSGESTDRLKLPREHTEVPPLVKTVHLDTCASFPLKMSHAASYLGDTDVGGLPKRTVLIGDAAHTVHPMAGQGLNLGLGDATVLFEVLEKAIADGADIGSKLALNEYPRKRYLANHTVMNVIDKLHKLYAMEAAPIVWARSTGVEILNELPSLKNAMMGTAGARGGTGGDGRAGLWGGIAKAYDVADSARNIGGVVAGMVRNRIASSMSKQ